MQSAIKFMNSRSKFGSWQAEKSTPTSIQIMSNENHYIHATQAFSVGSSGTIIGMPLQSMASQLTNKTRSNEEGVGGSQETRAEE